MGSSNDKVTPYDVYYGQNQNKSSKDEREISRYREHVKPRYSNEWYRSQNYGYGDIGSSYIHSGYQTYYPNSSYLHNTIPFHNASHLALNNNYNVNGYYGNIARSQINNYMYEAPDYDINNLPPNVSIVPTDDLRYSNVNNSLMNRSNVNAVNYTPDINASLPQINNTNNLHYIANANYVQERNPFINYAQEQMSQEDELNCTQNEFQDKINYSQNDLNDLQEQLNYPQNNFSNPEDTLTYTQSNVEPTSDINSYIPENYVRLDFPIANLNIPKSPMEDNMNVETVVLMDQNDYRNYMQMIQ